MTESMLNVGALFALFGVPFAFHGLTIKFGWNKAGKN